MAACRIRVLCIPFNFLPLYIFKKNSLRQEKHNTYTKTVSYNFSCLYSYSETTIKCISIKFDIQIKEISVFFAKIWGYVCVTPFCRKTAPSENNKKSEILSIHLEPNYTIIHEL